MKATRRYFLAGASAATLFAAELADAAIHGKPTVSGGGPPPTLVPGGSWDGTPGSGGLPAPYDTSLQGSGWTEAVVANVIEAKYQWIESAAEITVAGFTGNRAGIKQVNAFCEGNSVTLTTQRLNTRLGRNGVPINTYGFSFIAQSPAAGTRDGIARYYFDVIPYNGYARRIQLDLILNTAGTFSRPIYFVNNNGAGTFGGHTYGAGSDSNSTTQAQSRATPWATVEHALIAAGNGAIIKLAPGTYVASSNVGTLNSNTLSISLRPDDGVAQNAVSVGWAGKEVNSNNRGGGAWQPLCAHLSFEDLTIEWSGITRIYPNLGGAAANGPSVFTVNNCRLNDSNGVSGPPDATGAGGSVNAAWTNTTNGFGRQLNGTGYYANNSPQNNFRVEDGQVWNILECTNNNNIYASPRLTRNVTADIAFDACFLNGATTLTYATATGCSITNTTLTIGTPVTGSFYQGMMISGTNAYNCLILQQLTGTPGGAGTYQVSVNHGATPVTITGTLAGIWNLASDIVYYGYKPTILYPWTQIRHDSSTVSVATAVYMAAYTAKSLLTWSYDSGTQQMTVTISGDPFDGHSAQAPGYVVILSGLPSAYNIPYIVDSVSGTTTRTVVMHPGDAQTPVTGSGSGVGTLLPNNWSGSGTSASSCLGATTITWNENVPMYQVVKPQNAQSYKFLTGDSRVTGITNTALLTGSGLNANYGPNDGYGFSNGEQNDPNVGGYNIMCQPGMVGGGAAGKTLVLGDCSTATGFNAVNNKARGFIVSHADTMQYGTFAAAGGPNPNNVMFVNYNWTGGAIGNASLIQPGFVTGTGTITTVGTAFTTSANALLVPNDGVQAPTSTGETRRVVSYNPTTQAGTLDSAFTADQTTVAFKIAKCATDHANVNMLGIPPTGPNYQRQTTKNFFDIQCSYLVVNLDYRNIISANPIYIQGVAALDSIYFNYTSDTTFPATGLSADGNQFLTGTARGTNAGTGGSVDGSGIPSGVRTMLGLASPNPNAGKPIFPYDVNGVVLSGSASSYPVGAVSR